MMLSVHLTEPINRSLKLSCGTFFSFILLLNLFSFLFLAFFKSFIREFL